MRDGRTGEAYRKSDDKGFATNMSLPRFFTSHGDRAGGDAGGVILSPTGVMRRLSANRAMAFRLVNNNGFIYAARIIIRKKRLMMFRRCVHYVRLMSPVNSGN